MPSEFMRKNDIENFYFALEDLENKIEGKRMLRDFNRRAFCPQRGIYFFFENGEVRENGQPRVIRIGTHALRINARSTLRGRLLQHRGYVRGNFSGGGNHRGSIFRLHIGFAIMAKNGILMESWGQGNAAPLSVRRDEYVLEKLVSDYITSLPFLFLAINDPPGPGSLRGYFERNSIALLSNYGRTIAIDPPSNNWLGSYARCDEIRRSGLWNINHVQENYDRNFTGALKKLISQL